MRKLVTLLLVLAGVGAAVWFLVYRPSPRYAVGRLGAAVATRDTAAIYRYADLTAVAEGLAGEVEDDAARLIGDVLRGGPDALNPYLVSLGEQLVWTAMMRADSGPAIAGHVVSARAVQSTGVRGDSADAVVTVPIVLPSVRLDTVVDARLVFARRDGEWILVAVRDVAAALLRSAMQAYLRQSTVP